MTRVIQVKVKPNSRVEELAAHFGIRKAQVSIKSGSSSRMKRIQLAD